MVNNPVTYALQQVRFEIPREILDKVFISLAAQRAGPYLNRLAPISVDARIREEVLDARVLVDTNLYGGREMMIVLDDCPSEMIDPYNIIYRVPKSLTGGGTITRATSVQMATSPLHGNMRTGINAYRGSQILDAAQSVLNSQSAAAPISTSYVQVIAENVVHIMDATGMLPNISLRCWVTNDDTLSHLMPTSYRKFAELVVWATKAFIYINAQIIMDKGFISAGSELGRFRETIDEYRDANENYKDLLEKVWPKVALLNDQNAKARHIKLAVGGGW